ncbi:MAG: hypothetical protein AAF478_09290, partial [Pseudomonadota bacterium]
LVAEFFIPQYRGELWNSGFEFDDILGWKVQPNLTKIKFGFNDDYLVSTDGFGFRNEADNDGKKFSLVMQGDSNAFGFGVKNGDTACAKLQSNFSHSCYNVGTPGYDVNHFLLQKKNIPYDFERVVLLFNLYNDFTMSAFLSPYGVRRSYYFPSNGKIALKLSTMPVYKQVYGYRFIDELSQFDDSIKKFSVGFDWGNYLPGWVRYSILLQHMLVNHEKTLTSISSTINSTDYEALDQNNFPNGADWLLLKRDKWPEPFLSYSKKFEEIFGEYVAQNPGIIVVLKPLRKQVLEDNKSKAIKRLIQIGFDANDIELNSQNRFIQKITEKHGGKVLDVTKVFTTHPNNSQLYLENDSHISAVGHKLIAEQIAQFLQN